jgi:V/A-type H+-transporting ATPase subunit E
MVAEAKAEAEEIVQKARADMDVERTASQEAFKVAIRDTRLELGEELKAVFASHVRRLVSAELEDKDFLRQLLLTIAGRAAAAVPEGQPFEVLVCQDVIESSDECKAVSENSKEALRHFVLGVSGEMLREGVELRPSGNVDAGIRIRLVGEDVEIDLTDKALSNLILKHLLPRYRKIVQGVD